MKQIQFAYINTKILIFERCCTATNYVTATFHPTIGQCAHQSLSDTATPELGMISSRNKGTLVESYIAKVQQHSAKPTQLGYQDVREKIPTYGFHRPLSQAISQLGIID